MQRVLTVFGFVVGISVVLIAITWGIFRLQGEGTTTGPVSIIYPATSSSKTEAAMPTDRRMETREVQVTFKKDGSMYFSGRAPLLKAETSGDSRTSRIITIDAAGIHDLMARLPDLPAPAGMAEAQLETDRKGQPRRIIRGPVAPAIDRAAMARQLQESLAKNPTVDSISVPVLTTQAEGSEGFEALRAKQGFKVCLASFVTVHVDHMDDVGRNENLRLAAEKIDGIILQPGEEFSFNKIVKERSRKNGFQMAGVISNGKVIPGLGGGICQVSTTMYRVTLQSNLKTLERYNHSIYDGIQYADRGLDAAVVWGAKDFRFRNTLDVPLLFSVISGPGRVQVAAYAPSKPFDKVEIITRNERKLPLETKKVVNRKLKSGESKIVQTGVVGYTIEAFRIITTNGVSREERLSHDRYSTFPRIEEVSN